MDTRKIADLSVDEFFEIIGSRLEDRLDRLRDEIESDIEKRCMHLANRITNISNRQTELINRIDS